MPEQLHMLLVVVLLSKYSKQASQPTAMQLTN